MPNTYFCFCIPWFAIKGGNTTIEFWVDGTDRNTNNPQITISNSTPTDGLHQIYQASLALTIIAAIFAGIWVLMAFFSVCKYKDGHQKHVHFTSATLTLLFALIATLVFSIGTAEYKYTIVGITEQPYKKFWYNDSSLDYSYGPSAGWYLTLIATVVSGVGVFFLKE